tara:strand:- start:86 stop:493 length:408 start_codon:yes stop_codon:yes gene_type:complete
MSQKSVLTPLQFKDISENCYSSHKNKKDYEFFIKYSPLVRYNHKGPSDLCYINEGKFGEISGCAETQQYIKSTNYSVINKISNNNFTSRLFKYDNNYISKPSFFDWEKQERMILLNNLKHFNDENLYKNYCPLKN